MYRLILTSIFILGSMIMVSAQESEDLSAGDRRVDDFGISQVYVPAGCFMMGTSADEAAYAETLDAPSWAINRLPSEQPQREVCLTEGYWIDEFEVTNAAFQAFIDDGGYTTEDYWSAAGWNWLEDQNVDRLHYLCWGTHDEAELPVACMSYYQAEAYANWRGGRLPTEAEWEFAARGPESNIYPWGNEWDSSLANIEDSRGAVAVGSYPDGVSWVGAHDMAGNVMEWVSDWLADDYSDLLDQTENPTGPSSGTIKIEKGGWWGSNALVARSAYRHFEDPPRYRDDHIGFRIVTPIATSSDTSE
ncbi:MAG: SUMF1/EgtB/PvdO family nonheme iron enzyme [Chloroflexota bacterium]